MKLVGNKVTNHRGDVLAEKIRGKWESKDPTVLAFIKSQETPAPVKKKAKPEVKVEEVLEIVPAVDEEGNAVADDPTTPDVDESWVVKSVKKVIKKS